MNDSVAWDAIYDKVTHRFDEVQFIVMDAGYKTPWIAKKILDDSRIPILPYTQSKTAKGHFRPWEYKYDVVTDALTALSEILCKRKMQCKTERKLFKAGAATAAAALSTK